MTTKPTMVDGQCAARIMRDDIAADRAVRDDLFSDPHIEVVDRFAEQLAAVRELLPVVEPAFEEPKRWASYPWRPSMVSILGPRAFRALRLNRNQHTITADEQSRLAALRIGVVGLSAGHAIASTLATEGICGVLRLTDFDDLELSSLNRVPATVFDIGRNKAIVAARRIAEIDPYLTVEVMTSGATAENVDARRIPVIMASSDRGLLDVERFDLEPERPIFHGALGRVDAASLRGLSTEDKVPYVLGILDGSALSPRLAASLIEVGYSLSGWPQLASDIWAGAAAVATAVRRIGLGQTMNSGRIRVDLAAVLDHPTQPPKASDDRAWTAQAADEPGDANQSPSVGEIIAEAAMRAPSGGNVQPWHVAVERDFVSIRLAPEHNSALDIGFRASAVGLGAAVFNARVAAAAHRAEGAVEVDMTRDALPQVRLRYGAGGDPTLAALYRPMLARETNRHVGRPAEITAETRQALESAARDHGGRLRLALEKDEIESVAEILAESDRIRYLTPRLHRQMLGELRWPGDPSPDSGLDVRGLELEPSEMSAFAVLQRPEVMAELARWDAGTALGKYIRKRVMAASGLALICVDGGQLTDYLRGGTAAEAVWVLAHQHGLAVQPMSPIFLCAQNQEELDELSPAFARRLCQLQSELRDVFSVTAGEHGVLLLRLFDAPPPSVRSRRRGCRIGARAGDAVAGV